MSGPVLHLASDELDKATKRLAGWRWGAERAIQYSLSIAGDGLKTDAVQETRKKYFLTAQEIREHLAYKKTGGSDYHTATLTVKGHTKRIKDYKVGGRGNVPKVAVKREGGTKPLKTGFFRDYNGQKIVLWRPSGVPGPARAVLSPSVPQVVKNEETVAAMEKGAAERFRKQLDHNIARMLAGGWRGERRRR